MQVERWDTERAWGRAGSALLPRERPPVDLAELVPVPRRVLRSAVPVLDDDLDVRLHAPTADAVIVRVDGPVHQRTSTLLAMRVRQQLHRAPHVILDLTSVTWLDVRVAAELLALCETARACGTRMHIAAENDLVVDALRRIGMGKHVVRASADAVVAGLR